MVEGLHKKWKKRMSTGRHEFDGSTNSTLIIQSTLEKTFQFNIVLPPTLTESSFHLTDLNSVLEVSSFVIIPDPVMPPAARPITDYVSLEKQQPLKTCINADRREKPKKLCSAHPVYQARYIPNGNWKD